MSGYWRLEARRFKEHNQGMTWAVLPDKAGGYYARAQQSGREMWRSLTAKDKATALQWLDSAYCHGTDNHAVTCDYCGGEGLREQT